MCCGCSCCSGGGDGGGGNAAGILQQLNTSFTRTHTHRDKLARHSESSGTFSENENDDDDGKDDVYTHRAVRLTCQLDTVPQQLKHQPTSDDDDNNNNKSSCVRCLCQLLRASQTASESEPPQPQMSPRSVSRSVGRMNGWKDGIALRLRLAAGGSSARSAWFLLGSTRLIDELQPQPQPQAPSLTLQIRAPANGVAIVLRARKHLWLRGASSHHEAGAN